jgi:hypothetical protein
MAGRQGMSLLMETSLTVFVFPERRRKSKILAGELKILKIDHKKIINKNR